MPQVITPKEWYDIVERYDENGWLTQRDQDRLENTVWWSHREAYDLRIAGHELSNWFDDFYAYIDQAIPSRKIPKRSKPKPKPAQKPVIKSKHKVKYPWEKDLREDEEVFVWSEPILHTGKDLRESLGEFNVKCLGHTLKLQVKNNGHCRMICTACNRSEELSQLIDYVLSLAPDMIREMGGIIFEDGTFCFPVSEKSVALG